MLLASLVLLASAFARPSFAGDTDPLFVNITTNDVHRARMAITFGTAQMERGHPLTIFLNDRGVLIGSRANSATFAEHQKALAEAMAKGAVVIVCPMCMKHYGVKPADLLPGAEVGKPELTGGALFKEGTRTLSW
jgi:sulfur relay (sulfurtransferase) complex TusBCD TusD component (DsrE family)